MCQTAGQEKLAQDIFTCDREHIQRFSRGLTFFVDPYGGAAMSSPDKTRVIAFSVFLVALIAFAILYRPTSALSRPVAGDGPILPVGKTLEIKAPLGLPPIPIPADNPPTADTVALGRRLYYDPALSADNTISCASCHGPQMGFTDTRPVSVGVGGRRGRGTLQQSLILGTTHCNSGMGVLRALRSKRRVQSRIR